MGFIPHVIQAVTVAVTRRPELTLVCVLVVTLLTLGLTARFLTFKTNRADLIDPHTEFHQRWKHFIEKFGDDSDVVIVVEGAGETEIVPVLEQIGSRLAAERKLFDRVLYKVDTRPLQGKALQYLPPNVLARARAQLESLAPVLAGDWHQAGVEAHAHRLAAFIGHSSVTGSPAQLRESLNHAHVFVDSFTGFLRDQHAFKSPWPEVISRDAFPSSNDGGAIGTRYQLSASGKMGFVLALPSDISTDFSGTSKSLAKLEKVVADARVDHPSVAIGLTGIPVLEADEMKRSQADMTKASGISFLGVLLISLIGFRGYRHPFMSMTMLAVGIAWAMGYTTLIIGHLNILSLSFATILIGVGDYGTHYIAAYLAERHKGLSLMEALLQTSRSVGTGIVTAAVTTALSFFAAMFTDFLGVAELGIIAGGGILLCAIATFVVLPPLIVLSDRKLEPRQLPTPFQGNILRQLIRRAPGAVTVASVVVLLVVGSQAFKFENGQLGFRVRYDYNLLNLQAKGVKSVELQQRIFDEANGSLLYAVSLTNSPERVRELREKFLTLSTVSRVEDLAAYMPAHAAMETVPHVGEIHSLLSQLSGVPPASPAVDPSAAGAALESLFRALSTQPDAQSRQAALALDAVLNQLEQLPLEPQMQLLTGYDRAMQLALHGQLRMLAAISDPAPVTPADFPEALRTRFVSSTGDWLLRVYPKDEIWDEAPLTAFVKDVRTVDPEITGTPLQNYEAAGQIQASYFNAAVYALAVIVLVLLIDALESGPLVVALVAPISAVAFSIVLMHRGSEPLQPVLLVSIYLATATIIGLIFDARNVITTLLALLPPLGGILVLFGILGIAGINANPANLIVLPLILGIGMDSGVYVIHDYRQQRGRYEIARSTVNAVTMTSLTTMVGFGSMMVAAHQGLVSLGLVLTIGVASCLFISLVLLPAILTLRTRDRHDAADEQGDDANSDAEAVDWRRKMIPVDRFADAA